ncbi:hypothetical protein ABMA28_005863 [Loxostege sticticalis]|uniref:Uncharacterized protein n=1 Tax=Loxostege sticticalis TaxID=481309 RepID=A0ABD0SN52_LOXSC
MWIICYCFVSLVFLTVLNGHIETRRQRRYLVFTPATQWGVFVTASIPLHPEATVSVAWFIEANYFTIDNATWYEPLLGDVDVSLKKTQSYGPISPVPDEVPQSYLADNAIQSFTLTVYGYPGRACLLLSICENASAMFRHNGVVGDLLHLILTPSTSMSEEEIADSYYEAEYYGIEESCDQYSLNCPESPLDLLSVHVEKTS